MRGIDRFDGLTLPDVYFGTIGRWLEAADGLILRVTTVDYYNYR